MKPVATPPLPERHNVSRGVVYLVIASLAYAVMQALVKALSNYEVPQIVFFRSSIALVIVAAYSASGKRGLTLGTTRLAGHLLRALFGLTAMSSYFTAYRYLGLADVSALAFSLPLFVLLLSIFFLGERPGIHRWIGLLVGLLGVLVMVRPGFVSFESASLLVLFASLNGAGAMIMIRRLSSTEEITTIVCYFLGFCTLISGTIMPFFWQTPNGTDLLLFCACGASGAFGQLFTAAAYKHAEASFISPFRYTQLLWATLLGYLVFAEIPHFAVLLGAAIVLLGQGYMIHREGKEKTSSPARDAEPAIPD